MNNNDKYILGLEECADLQDFVGGKAASLGLMLKVLDSNPDILVPRGFVLSVRCIDAILKSNSRFLRLFEKLSLNLSEKDLIMLCKKIRYQIVNHTEIPEDIRLKILDAYDNLLSGEPLLHVAVRSSAKAEDTFKMSMAGQYDSFLHISSFSDCLSKIKKCIASQFSDRVILSLRNKNMSSSLSSFSVIVQEMVSVDNGSSGVVFTHDPELRRSDVVVVESVKGLGEILVQGQVTPSHFKIYKPLSKHHASVISKRLSKQRYMYQYINDRLCKVEVSPDEQRSFVLSSDDIMKIVRASVMLEEYFKQTNDLVEAVDIEWAKGGENQKTHFVQMRPYLISKQESSNTVINITITEAGKILTKGIGIGLGIQTSKVSVIRSVQEFGSFIDGSILVAPITNPQWMPIMLKASGFITDRGTSSSHAAIVARELNLPCILGTENGTDVLRVGQKISMYCDGSGEGIVYDGTVQYMQEEYKLDMRPTKTEILLHVGIPSTAFRHSNLPNDGVGAARTEFVSSSIIGIHPKALIEYDVLQYEFLNLLKNGDARSERCKTLRKIVGSIDQRTLGYHNKREYFVDKLSQGIGEIASAFYPKPIFAKLSDFKTNEYRDMIGGELYEPSEENPMLGWRGASRYYDDRFVEVFEMECEAFRRVRKEMNLKNVNIMIPFCRTVKEAGIVIDLLSKFGLEKGKDELKVFGLMEVPGQVLQADEYAEIFDGFLLGLNDLFQTTLSVDRDSERVSHLLNPNDQSFLKAVGLLIRSAKKHKKKIRAIGEMISTNEDFVRFLIRQGIDGVVVDPDPNVLMRMSNIIFDEERKVNG